EREVEDLAPAGEVFGELAFGRDEDRMRRILGDDLAPDATRPVVLPQDRGEPGTRCDECQDADRRTHRRSDMDLGGCASSGGHVRPPAKGIMTSYTWPHR